MYACKIIQVQIVTSSLEVLIFPFLFQSVLEGPTPMYKGHKHIQHRIYWNHQDSQARYFFRNLLCSEIVFVKFPPTLPSFFNRSPLILEVINVSRYNCVNMNDIYIYSITQYHSVDQNQQTFIPERNAYLSSSPSKLSLQSSSSKSFWSISNSKSATTSEFAASVFCLHESIFFW